MKNQNLSMTARLPSVEECEKCAFQDECEGGKYCVPSAKKGQPANYYNVDGWIKEIAKEYGVEGEE